MIDERQQSEPDILVEEDPKDASETAAEKEIDAEDEDQRRRRRRKRRQPRGETAAEIAFDPAAFQKRLPSLVQNPKFRAWIKENHPTIRSRTELTPEIVDQFDDCFFQAAREKSQHRIATPHIGPPDPELAEFLEVAFSYDCNRSAWPWAFREWVSAKYDIQRRDEVTRAIMTEWREYDAAQHLAHREKADFDYEELDPGEYDAGNEQWLHEKHSYFEFTPNTRAEWDKLIQRWAFRVVEECAEANLKAAKQRAEAAEERRRKSLVSELKRRELPPVNGPVPKLAAIGDARETHRKERLELLKAWSARFSGLPGVVRRAWQASHNLDEEYWKLGGDGFDGVVYLTPNDGFDVGTDNAEEVSVGLQDPAFLEFRRFSEGVRQAIKALDDNLESLLNPPADAYVPHRGYTLEQIPDEDERYVLADVVPEGLAVLYGAPKVGKSAWAQKLSACVSGGSTFDGTEVAHGGVLYVSCDTGARAGAVKRRLADIMSQLGIASNRNLVVVEDPVTLNDPTSVASLLEQNPGKFTLVVIDPLYQCVTGSLMQDAVMMEAVKGLGTISRRTGAAVLLVHHEPRGSKHLFGSMLLDAALDAQIHVERDRDIVTVKVELLKNGEPPKRPFVYQFEGAYLAPTTAASRAKGSDTETAPAANARYSEILALLPDKPIREAEARKLVERLLHGKNADARRQQWHRALQAMAKAGQVTRRGGMVQRQLSEKP